MSSLRSTPTSRAVTGRVALPARHLAALATVAFALVLAMGAVTPAWSYFTDRSYATGGIRIHVAPDTNMREDYGDRTKHVVITNSGDAAVPVYARVRVDANAKYLEAGGVGGTNWTSSPDADGWYYYLLPIQPGSLDDDVAAPVGKSDELTAKIVFPVSVTRTITYPDGTTEVTTEEIDHTGEAFNVVVIYEATPVQYDASGNALAPQECDWTLEAPMAETDANQGGE